MPNQFVRSYALTAVLVASLVGQAPAAEKPSTWLWSTAYAIPKHTTSEGSGYFSIVEGTAGKLYVGTAKYHQNAYLVEYDEKTHKMNVVVDCHKEIGTQVTGFAAQAKIHTRNNTGKSGKIYFGTKQGYPKKGEKRTDYLGGYPMVFDPASGKTRVYEIPVPHQGIISIAPDESRGVAYLSTCDDARPTESTHFMILDLKSGKTRDLMDCRHMYTFIVVDYLGRAYHPILGGDVARYDPRSDQLQRLKQTIDGQPPSVESLLATPESHPINWDISPDGKTLYSVAMSGNGLYSYDLTGEGKTLRGKFLGKLSQDARKTDCRAMCVDLHGVVWMGVKVDGSSGKHQLHVIEYRPGDSAPFDHGPIAISNPKYTEFTDATGKALPQHHGVVKQGDDPLVPRYVIMGICAARGGTVYVTTLYPFTLHAMKPLRKGR